MKGQHCAPRQGAGPDRVVLAALAAPPAIALTLALGIASAAFLILLGAAGVIVRVPARAWLWLGLGLSWPAAIALLDAGVLHGREPYMAGATGTCLFAAGLLTLRSTERRRLQRQWRETGGRMTPPGPLTPAERAYQFSRLDRIETRLDEQEAWNREMEALRQRNGPRLDALAGIVREAHEAEGLPVPEALQVSTDTMPLGKPLRLVWNAQRERGA